MPNVSVVAMDIHKGFSKAVVLDGVGEVLESFQVSHDKRGTMEEFFGRFSPETDVVLEATFNWPWIADMAKDVKPSSSG